MDSSNNLQFALENGFSKEQYEQCVKCFNCTMNTMNEGPIFWELMKDMNDHPELHEKDRNQMIKDGL